MSDFSASPPPEDTRDLSSAFTSAIERESVRKGKSREGKKEGKKMCLGPFYRPPESDDQEWFYLINPAGTCLWLYLSCAHEGWTVTLFPFFPFQPIWYLFLFVLHWIAFQPHVSQ
jgi:hypothetical protein